MLSVGEAIMGRQSIRAFDSSKIVDFETIDLVLAQGSRAPNGSNIQPWHVHVLTGAGLRDFSGEIERAHQHDATEVRDYAYYMEAWRDPYLGRRRSTGWGLYGRLGIQKSDKAAMKAQQGRNYRFFDAPVGLIVTMDRDMGQGAWLDMGAFVQTILLAARGAGLEACPIAAFCNFPGRIRSLLNLPHDALIVTGIALGYPCTDAVVNQFRTPRRSVPEFTTYHDTLPMQVAAE
ncbi:MAG: nitroreductase [Pseudomonadota bacterium]